MQGSLRGPKHGLVLGAALPWCTYPRTALGQPLACRMIRAGRGRAHTPLLRHKSLHAAQTPCHAPHTPDATMTAPDSHACACLPFLALKIHVGVVSYLRHKFNSLGYHDAQPDLELPTGGVVTAMLQDSTSLGRFARGRPAAGIPVFNIPLSSAVVGRLSEADACGCSACQGRPLPGYAYLHPDAAGEAELREAMAAALRRAGMDGEVLVGEAAAAAAAAGPGGRGADMPAVAVPQLVPQGGSAAAGAAASALGPVSIAVGPASAGERASGHVASSADVEEARGGGVAGPAPAASAPGDGPGPGPQSGPGPAHATPFPLNLLLVEGIPVDSLPSEVGRSRSSRRLRPASSVSQSRLLRLLSSAALASPAVAPVPAGGQLPAATPRSQRPPLGSPPTPWQQLAQQERQQHGTPEHEQSTPGYHYQQQQQEGVRQQQQPLGQQQEGQRQVSRAPSLAPVDSVSPRGSSALSAQSPIGDGSGWVQAPRRSRRAS